MSEKSRSSSPLPQGSEFQFRSIQSLHEEYRFEEDKDKIGCGAFSVVYRAMPSHRSVAMDRALHTARTAGLELEGNSSPQLFVALKVLPREHWDNEKANRQRRDVQREALVLSRVRGLRGCTLLVETLQTENLFGIVMLLEDPHCVNCGQYLAANGRLNESHAALILYQLLTTIQQLHSDVQLLHHDIKLENIVLCGPTPLQLQLLTPKVSTTLGSPTPSLNSLCPPPPQQSLERDAGADGLPYCLAPPPPAPLQPPPATAEEESPASLPPGARGLPTGSKSGTVMKVSMGMSDQRSKSANDGVDSSASHSPLSPLISAFPDDVPVAWLPFSRVVLVDFGLARCLDGSNLNQSWDASGAMPPAPTPQQAVSPAAVVQVGCCGTDRYLPAELLEMADTGSESKEMASEQACKIDAYAIGVVAYLLLSGCFPYGARTKSQLYRQQRSTPLRMDSVAWKGISLNAKEFVRGLLTTDPNGRWSTLEALAHPWMAEAKQAAVAARVLTSTEV